MLKDFFYYFLISSLVPSLFFLIGIKLSPLYLIQFLEKSSVWAINSILGWHQQQAGTDIARCTNQDARVEEKLSISKLHPNGPRDSLQGNNGLVSVAKIHT